MLSFKMTDAGIKEFVVEWLAKAQAPPQGMESDLELAKEKIQKLEDNQTLLLEEIKKMQVLKDETKNQREEIVVYKKAMNMMAMEMISMQKGKISNLMDGKFKAVEDKLKIVEKENEDLVVRLKIKTTEKENAENSVSHVMSVLDTMTRANEARNNDKKSIRKCREFNKPKGCSWGTKCRFDHDPEDEMVTKSDCSFWLEGRCKFSDEDCRNTHNPTKKGNKQTANKGNKQAVFQIAQNQSPPPGLDTQQISAQGLENEEGWITPVSKQKKRKMKVAARRLGGEQQTAPQLEEQSTPTSHLTGEASQLAGPATPTCPLVGETNMTQTSQQIMLQVVQTLLQHAGVATKI